MSSLREWKCDACNAAWDADFDQRKCWRCGSTDVRPEQHFPQPSTPIAKIVAHPGFNQCATQLREALTRAGLSLERTSSRAAFGGMTKEMGLVAALVLDGVVQLEGPDATVEK